MTGPLAQQFALLWERLNWICSDSLDLPLTLGDGDTALNHQTPEMGEVSAWFAESRAALSAIERHVQDAERIIEYASLLVWHDSGDGTGPHLSTDPAYWPEQDRLRRALEERWDALHPAALPAREKEEE